MKFYKDSIFIKKIMAISFVSKNKMGIKKKYLIIINFFFKFYINFILFFNFFLSYKTNINLTLF
jgi:hypothetical protein